MTATPVRGLLGWSARRREGVLLLATPDPDPLQPGDGPRLLADLARCGRDFLYHVPGAADGAPPGPSAVVEPSYGRGEIALATRLALHVLRRRRCAVHHWFLPADPALGRRARALARLARRPLVHTLMSPPRITAAGAVGLFGDRTVVLDEASARLLRSAGVAGVELVRPAVVLPPRPADRDAGRARLHLTRPGLVDGDGPVFVGLDDSSSGASARDLLAAVGALVARHPGVRVVLLSRGAAAADRRQRAWSRHVAELGLGSHVRIAEPGTDTRALLASADAVVACSADPGDGPSVPRLLLEAMALGRPAVVSDRPALAELASLGEGTLVATAGDAASLADRLEALADSPSLAARLGRAARRTVRSHFRPDAMAVAYEALYRDLLG